MHRWPWTITGNRLVKIYSFDQKINSKQRRDDHIPKCKCEYSTVKSVCQSWFGAVSVPRRWAGSAWKRSAFRTPPSIAVFRRTGKVELLDEPDNLELLGRGVPHAAQPDQNSNGSALGFSVDREAQGIDPDTAYRAARSLPYHLALQ